MHSLGKLRTHESMIKDASANPLGWPDLCNHIFDPKKRREAIMRKDVYKANNHHSMEFEPMINIDPITECSPAPTHQLIGTSAKILGYADDAIDDAYWRDEAMRRDATEAWGRANALDWSETTEAARARGYGGDRDRSFTRGAARVGRGPERAERRVALGRRVG